MVLIFIYPGVTKKTKINAHELEALRFFFPRSEHTQNTHYRQGALGWATASRWATASQRQGRAGGRAGCTLCGCGWLHVCTHAPCEHQLLAARRADQRSSGDVERTSRYRQVRLVVNGQVLLSDTLYTRKMMRAHESESAREHMRARARARARENELLDRDRETERESVCVRERVCV